jgi:hypothetical protein
MQSKYATSLNYLQLHISFTEIDVKKALIIYVLVRIQKYHIYEKVSYVLFSKLMQKLQLKWLKEKR